MIEPKPLYGSPNPGLAIPSFAARCGMTLTSRTSRMPPFSTGTILHWTFAGRIA